MNALIYVVIPVVLTAIVTGVVAWLSASADKLRNSLISLFGTGLVTGVLALAIYAINTLAVAPTTTTPPTPVVVSTPTPGVVNFAEAVKVCMSAGGTPEMTATGGFICHPPTGGAATSNPTAGGATPVPGSSGSCPPSTRWLGASAQLQVEIKVGEAYHLNVSRFAPPAVAHAGGDMESNYLITLTAGVKWVKITFDGSGYAYPLSIVNSTKDCQLAVETLGRGENWPEAMVGIPNSVFVFNHPYGVVDKNTYPDIIYRIEWEDASGVHTWPSGGSISTPVALATIPSSGMTSQPVDLGGGKPLSITLKPGYYLVHTACSGCTRGVEDVRVFKYTGAGTTISNPEGNATFFPLDYPFNLIVARVKSESTRFPNDKPGWLDVVGIEIVTIK